MCSDFARISRHNNRKRCNGTFWEIFCVSMCKSELRRVTRMRSDDHSNHWSSEAVLDAAKKLRHSRRENYRRFAKPPCKNREGEKERERGVEKRERERAPLEHPFVILVRLGRCKWRRLGYSSPDDGHGKMHI